jgi:hypothetical protein
VARDDLPAQGRFQPHGPARADARSAALEIDNDWTIDGRTRLGERLTAALREEGIASVLALTYRLTPEWDLALDHQAFGGFCVRARNDGTSAYTDPHGAVTRPDPHYSASRKAAR